MTGGVPDSARPLAVLRSIKVKLGVLVAASVLVATVLSTIGAADTVPPWLAIPVTVAAALAVTQLLAIGMVAPLRQMTDAAGRMARGDYRARVDATSRDEVGELARAFNTMAEDLATVDQQRRDLIGMVSHELRTPLAALSAVIENLADGVVAPDPTALRAAAAQTERLTALVTDLLDLSRLEAGISRLQPAEIDVADLLASCVTEAEIAGRRVGFAVDVGAAGATVVADEARLRQVVANLLDNAARYSPPGAEVRISADARDGRWWLEVTDQGPGVDPADRERAFERFGQLDQREAAGGAGTTGLGLAIARWVADLHAGTVRFVDPVPGEGACVRLELPLRTTAPPGRPGSSRPSGDHRSPAGVRTPMPRTPTPHQGGSP